MSMFTSPGSSGGGWSAADSEGHLVVVEVQGYETGVITANGERDAVKATVHDIDDAATYDDVLIFPKVLVGSLKGRVGQKVLGTIGKGVAKPGQNAPWVLFDASTDTSAVDKATAYLTGQVADSLAAAPAATPAAAGKVDLAGKTPEQIAALKEMGLA